MRAEKRWQQLKRKRWVPVLYPLQEPLGPAAQAINPDPHLGEGSNVQDLHDEGVILFPLKSGGRRGIA